MKFVELNNRQLPPADHHVSMELEIDTAKTRRLRGVAGYILFYASVCIALVYVFVQFTASLRLAMALVGIMVAYMTLMGWLAGRTAERRD
jgi:hypothetical protein